MQPIDHIVVLMFENRSFDHMLGAIPGVDGTRGLPPKINTDDGGTNYGQQEMTDPIISPDPKHELQNVLFQLQNQNGNFIRDYSRQYPTSSKADRQRIMNFYRLGFLDALHALAQSFTVCDRWFSSVPGPTWTNRFFVHTGTSIGRVKMPEGVFNPNLHDYNQDTIYDRLNERGVPWKVYFGDIPQSFVLTHQRQIRNAIHCHGMAQFFRDANGAADAFPAYSFIEPNYFQANQNDDHPPHDALRAQRLLASVYSALRSNARLWASTLFVVLYDEHGGLFDHVPPPPAVPPDGHNEEYTFDRLGVRVPAVLVSPWVAHRVDSTVYDHTSLLHYVIDRWNLRPLTARVSAATPITGAIRTSGPPRDDTPAGLALASGARVTTLLDVEQESDAQLNEHQRALIAFSRYLENELDDDPSAKNERSMAMLEGVGAQVEVAKRRVNQLIRQQRRKAGII